MTKAIQVTDAASFDALLGSIVRRSNNLVRDLKIGVGYVFNQIVDHGNSSPAMRLREVLPAIHAKPTGASVKRFDAFVRTFGGFEWAGTKADGSYQKVAPADVNLPAQGVAFWDHDNTSEKTEFSISEALARVIKRAHKEEVSDSEIIESISTVLRELQHPNAELADTLGVQGA